MSAHLGREGAAADESREQMKGSSVDVAATARVDDGAFSAEVQRRAARRAKKRERDKSWRVSKAFAACHVSDETEAAIEREARRLGLTKAEWMRRALTAALVAGGALCL